MQFGSNFSQYNANAKDLARLHFFYKADLVASTSINTIFAFRPGIRRPFAPVGASSCPTGAESFHVLFAQPGRVGADASFGGQKASGFPLEPLCVGMQ